VVGPGDGAGHGGHRVGVVAGVHGGEQGLLEILGGGKEAPVGPVRIAEVDKTNRSGSPASILLTARTLEPSNRRTVLFPSVVGDGPLRLALPSSLVPLNHRTVELSNRRTALSPIAPPMRAPRKRSRRSTFALSSSGLAASGDLPRVASAHRGRWRTGAREVLSHRVRKARQSGPGVHGEGQPGGVWTLLVVPIAKG
jgi:hypothetical protein